MPEATSRLVRYGDKTFPVQPGLTLEQVKAIMAKHFPELADPKVETKDEGGKAVWVFTKKAGRKG